MGLAAVEASLAGDAVGEGRQLLRDLREVNDQAITELRRIMSDLRPALLDDLGLAPALRSFVQNFAVRYPEITVTLSADRFARRLAPQYETVLFRAAQEALTNIARHAHATQAAVILEQRPGIARLEIRDNGVGFDPAALSSPAPGRGLGLVGMRERVTLVGGAWRVESAPDKGTRVTVELPIVE
jgi:signal transduction histidine kinase